VGAEIDGVDAPDGIFVPEWRCHRPLKEAFHEPG
jgi:hypothetical protein